MKHVKMTGMMGEKLMKVRKVMVNSQINVMGGFETQENKSWHTQADTRSVE